MDSRWQDQTTFFSPDDIGGGNCTEACFASLLDVPLDSIRKFYDKTDPEPVYRYWRNMENFAFSKGFWLHRMDCEFSYEGIYMVSGPAARGCTHMVIYQDGKLLHDPHPSRKGIEKVERTFLLIPLDPSQVKRER